MGVTEVVEIAEVVAEVVLQGQLPQEGMEGIFQGILVEQEDLARVQEVPVGIIMQLVLRGLLREVVAVDMGEPEVPLVKEPRAR